MGFWEWVAKYALDGIAGGVVGGAVTGAAVWWTVRHERRERQRADRSARIDRVLQALVELHAVVQDFEMDARTDPGLAKEREQNVRSKLLFLEVVSGSVDPRLTHRIKDLREKLANLPRRGMHGIPQVAEARQFKSEAELTVLTEIAVFNEFDPDDLSDADRVDLE